MITINQHTELNLVIGHPLHHTKSPVLHQAIYEALGINAVLLARPHTDLTTLIAGIKALSVGLCAITMPFKEAILPFLDEISPEVQVLGAANTIIQKNGKLYGYNTDVAGIMHALSDVKLRGKNILILGAGGAARALSYVLQNQNAHLYFLNRTREKAELLAKEFQGQVIINANAIPFDIIVNTTPLGLYPHAQESPLEGYSFQKYQTVFDMVYNPLHTRLLTQAKRAGAHIITGIEMFIGQALKQVELWQSLEQPLVQDHRIHFQSLKNLIMETTP